jgi:hypothetical protein
LKTSKPQPPPKRQTAQEFLELQRLMARAVMRPLADDGGMQAKWDNGQPMPKVAGSFIKPNDRLTSLERLEIYNRQYWFRLKDCFYDDYPGLRAVLGDDAFERLALAYLKDNPSQSFTLRNLGRGLVDFIAKNPTLIPPPRTLVLDMARLEWAHIEAFDNEAKPPLEMDSLLGADPAEIHLQLQPHLTVLQLGYAVDEFLIQVKQGERLRSEASNAMEQEQVRRRTRLKRALKPQSVFLAVHRHHDTVYYKRLEAAQFGLLTAFRSGASLEEACASLGEADAKQIQSWFQGWASLGWFCQLQ